MPPAVPFPSSPPLIIMSKYNWVIVFADNTKLKIANARGAMDAAVKARLSYGKLDSMVTEMQRHVGHNPGPVYKTYRWKNRRMDGSLSDYRVQAALKRQGQPTLPAPDAGPVGHGMGPGGAMGQQPPAYSEVGKLRAELIAMTTAYQRERDQRDLLMKQHAELERKYAEALERIKELESKPRTFKRIL